MNEHKELWEKIGNDWKDEYTKIANRYSLSYSFMNSFMEIILSQPIQLNEKEIIKRRESLMAYILKTHTKEINVYKTNICKGLTKEEIDEYGYNKMLTVTSLYIQEAMTHAEFNKAKGEYEAAKDRMFPNRKRKENEDGTNNGKRKRKRN